MLYHVFYSFWHDGHVSSAVITIIMASEVFLRGKRLPKKQRKKEEKEEGRGRGGTRSICRTWVYVGYECVFKPDCLPVHLWLDFTKALASLTVKRVNGHSKATDTHHRSTLSTFPLIQWVISFILFLRKQIGGQWIWVIWSLSQKSASRAGIWGQDVWSHSLTLKLLGSTRVEWLLEATHQCMNG